uniref:FBA_2 domain-containing protein n=1 Tax=Steinernema glaseri TaxID=37863 RepID=A0A1I7YKB6_9BILA
MIREVHGYSAEIEALFSRIVNWGLPQNLVIVDTRVTPRTVALIMENVARLQWGSISLDAFCPFVTKQQLTTFFSEWNKEPFQLTLKVPFANASSLSRKEISDICGFDLYVRKAKFCNFINMNENVHISVRPNEFFFLITFDGLNPCPCNPSRDYYTH